MDSFIGWVGGKKLLRKAVYERFLEKIGKYVEPFGGAAWVLLFKEKHVDMESYNDINSHLVNLFRCVKFHPEAIIQEMDYLLNSREIFNCFKNLDLLGLTDIQKAARYLYLIRRLMEQGSVHSAQERGLSAAWLNLRTYKNGLNGLLLKIRTMTRLSSSMTAKKSYFTVIRPITEQNSFTILGALFLTRSSI